MSAVRKCSSGKRRFRDEAAAMLALATIERTRGVKAERRFYRCPECGGVHLTSTGRRFVR